MLTVQSSSSMGSISASHQPTTSSTRLALGIVIMVLLVLLAVVGASAEHGAGTAQLRRGPASVVLSVLFTLGLLSGIGSLALLLWGLVRRNRRGLDSSAPRGRSPILIAGAALAVFACLSALLALAARRRHFQSVAMLSGPSLSHLGSATKSLPLNAAASLTTSGVVIGIVVVVVALRLVRSIGWRRAMNKLSRLVPDGASEPDGADGRRPQLAALSTRLAGISVADPGTEPDPRRAVIGCYLQMLEVAARYGPERRGSETPTEYLHRILAVTAACAAPASSLTGLFERARYSQRPVDESMRSAAIAALGALRNAFPAGAVG